MGNRNLAARPIPVTGKLQHSSMERRLLTFASIVLYLENICYTRLEQAEALHRKQLLAIE